MTGVVVDASTVLAWCFPDETSDYADGVLVSLERKTMLVPAVWSLEIANALLVGERKKRLKQPDIRRFTELLKSLSLVQDVQPVSEHVGNVLPLAHKYYLSPCAVVVPECVFKRPASCRPLRGSLAIGDHCGDLLELCGQLPITGQSVNFSLLCFPSFRW